MGVEKIIFSTQNTDDALKDLQGGQHPAFRNILVFSDNVSGVRKKNVPGTIKLADFPVSNQADCRGAAYYQPTNKSYFFFKDVPYGDSIVEYDATLDVCTLLVRNALFDFSQVNDIYIVDNLLYWNDAVKQPRKINIDEAKDHLYDGSNFKETGISLIRKQPILPPSGLRATDPLKAGTNPVIRRVSFQFALRYAFIDEEFSTLSNISRVFPPSNNEALTIADNFILLTLHIDKDMKPYVDHVELLVRYGNAGSWYRYDKIKTVDFTTADNDPDTGFQRFKTDYYFYNDKSGPQLGITETDPFFMAVPRLTDTMALTQDKLFVTDTLKGEYDLEEDQWSASVQITHEIDQEALKVLCDDIKPQPDFLLGKSRYSSGLVYFDESGRRTLVSAPPGLSILTPANINYRVDTTGSELTLVVSAQTSAISAAIQLTGKPPSWAFWVAPARTNNINYDWWQASKCLVQFPRSTAPTTQEEPTSVDYYLEGGYEYFDLKKYWSDIRDGGTTPLYSGFGTIIDITLPPDFPFAIDDQILTKFAFDLPKVGGGSINITDTVPVLEIVNSKIRIRIPIEITSQIKWSDIFSYTKNSGYSGVIYTATGDDFENSDYFLHFLFLHPVKQASSVVFYEVGELQAILNPGTEDRAFLGENLPIHGDCYAQGYTFYEPIKPRASGFGEVNGNISKIMFPSMSALTGKKRALFLEGIQTDQGKPTTDIDVTEEQTDGNVVRWSSGTLDKFLEANKFPIPSERGDVVKLVPSADNTLLAIHARSMTSLYIGQRMLKSPSGQETIVQSDDTIGYQKPLSLALGTINPESVVTSDGARIYGFDLNAGEPWRKGADGITPLATTFKTKKWFKQKADQLKAARALDPSVDIQIVGGVDPHLQMFFLTFKEVQYTVGPSTTIIPAETVGFSELAKGWLDHFDFTPERYVNHGQSILAVKNQKLWLHNADPVNCNKFYDVQYASEVTFVANMDNDTPKQWEYLSQASNGRWLVTSAVTPPSKENLVGQETDMNSDFCFEIRDGRHYVEFLKDKNTPAELIPPGKSARLYGAPMVSDVITVTIRNTEQKEIILDAVYIGFSPIIGHLMAPK